MEAARLEGHCENTALKKKFPWLIWLANKVPRNLLNYVTVYPDERANCVVHTEVIKFTCCLNLMENTVAFDSL